MLFNSRQGKTLCARGGPPFNTTAALTVIVAMVTMAASQQYLTVKSQVCGWEIATGLSQEGRPERASMREMEDRLALS